jgi:VWFA-related protein
VQNDSGRVRIRAWDASEVQAQIQTVSSGKLQPSFEVTAQKSGREIYLYSFFSGQFQEWVNLDVQVPRFLNVVVWGANPEIDLRGLAGSVRVENISGTISVDDVTSPLTVVSDRGDIVYRAEAQPQGDVHLESTTGDVLCELVNNLNLRGWMRGGSSIAWGQEPPVVGTLLEKHLGSSGPLLSAISLKGNIRVTLRPPGGPATAASNPMAAETQDRTPETVAKPRLTRRTESERAPDTPQSSPNPAPPAAAPQSAPSTSGGGVAIKVNVDTVFLNVSVRDRNTNRSIAGLQKDDFLVYENGVQQEVQQLLPTEAPFNLLLLLDVSGSTGSYIKLMKKAATEFTREINANDRIAVATFNSRVQLVLSFTSDREAAVRAIEHIQSGGGTAFYDALMTCLDEYMRDVEGRKAIVVFTDGVDNKLLGNRNEGSTTSFDELYRRVQESEAIIYTIFLDSEGQVPMQSGPVGRYPRRRGGFPLPLPFPLPSPGPFPSPAPSPHPTPRQDEKAAYETAREQLETIADQTGGRMYSPRRAEDLSGAYSEIANDLRIQYLLGYTSSDPARDGRWRSIRVEVKNHSEAAVRTRKGYYAVNRTAQAASTPS